LRIADSVADPGIGVGPPVPDVLADAKALGTLSPVAPGVQGPDGKVEELCELLDGEELVVVFHPAIIKGNPVI
jgi:hypothetical protein